MLLTAKKKTCLTPSIEKLIKIYSIILNFVDKTFRICRINLPPYEIEFNN